MVPHKGLRAGPLRLCSARKPHSTGIKLYCLADATSGYVVDMYLYTGRRGHLGRFGNSAGNYNAQQIMTMWAGLLPSGTILCADSFFGSYELARDLAAEGHAFLMMTKRSTYGVDKAGELLGEGQTATCTVNDARYAMVVFKNPKVGHKPPRVVQMLTNVHFPQAGPVHRRSGNEVNPVVANYRQLPRGVAGVNQMALQMRQMGRQMTGSHAVRAFVLRYAGVNAYATCRSLGGPERVPCLTGSGTLSGAAFVKRQWPSPSTCRCGCRAAGCAPIATGARPTTFVVGAASGTMWGALPRHMG